MNKFFTLMLRLALAAAFLVGLFGQVVVVPNAVLEAVTDSFWGSYNELHPYVVAYTVVAILGIACVQVALFALWRLLSMIQNGAIFSDRAFRWLDTIIGAALGATLLAFGVTVHLTFDVVPYSREDTMSALSVWGGAIICVGLGLSFAMLMVIMRGLLRKATELKSEMAEVI
ncbi:DUF2975 domain-containing protein [Glycomyces luteolus]|uniref:DUF2975 domain-containing protein n=1 Tax=Glycomyces luteolus TaxID=2670330 RepID=A0A9X3SRZ8_9ACTN|nr:DUF2975 domain-containing protein [Glycomyces luteolus]MDA1362307.1 DUF2975 domain-containing protein [Glycomyces luteolus]